jgi:hypothetical protein
MLKLNIRLPAGSSDAIVEVIDAALFTVTSPKGVVIFTQAASDERSLRRVLANVAAVYPSLDLNIEDEVSEVQNKDAARQADFEESINSARGGW